jgi:hypothetical protein
MAASMEVRRLKSLVRRYRLLVFRLVDAGMNYTSGEYCVFCSGNPGSKAADETKDGQVKHSRICPTRQAEKLAAVKI